MGEERVIERVLAWSGPDRFEYCHVWEHLGSLSARGTILRADHRVEYELDTAAGYVIKRLRVRASAPGLTRTVWLRRDIDGDWTARGDGDPEPVPDATDVELGNSLFFTGLPLRRRPGGHPLVVATIAIPELTLERREQRMTRLGFGAVRLDAETGSAELTVDADGYVLDYPGIAYRLVTDPMSRTPGSLRPTSENLKEEQPCRRTNERSRDTSTDSPSPTTPRSCPA